MRPNRNVDFIVPRRAARHLFAIAGEYLAASADRTWATSAYPTLAQSNVAAVEAGSIVAATTLSAWFIALREPGARLNRYDAAGFEVAETVG